MVLRQFKFLQEQFSISEEKLAFNFMAERHKHIKKTLFNMKNNLLKMIPSRPTYPEWPRSVNSIKDQPLNLDVCLINSDALDKNNDGNFRHLNRSYSNNLDL
jgi:hypothetical protein